MKFSMIFEAQLADPTAEHEHQVIHDCVEQAVFAEEMGFDRIWAVEHHSLKWYAHMSAPEIFLTWVAARTSTHPHRARRRVHAVQLQPPGPGRRAGRDARRCSPAAASTSAPAAARTKQEMSLCGVDRDARTAEVEEALRIIGHAWREGRVRVARRAPRHRPAPDPAPPGAGARTRRSSWRAPSTTPSSSPPNSASARW